MIPPWIRSRLLRLLPSRPAYGVPRPTLAAAPLTLAAQEIDTRGVTVPVPTFDRADPLTPPPFRAPDAGVRRDY